MPLAIELLARKVVMIYLSVYRLVLKGGLLGERTGSKEREVVESVCCLLQYFIL
jgi:hypothetical protein